MTKKERKTESVGNVLALIVRLGIVVAIIHFHVAHPFEWLFALVFYYSELLVRYVWRILTRLDKVLERLDVLVVLKAGMKPKND